MPKPTLTTSATVEVALEPRLKAQLRVKCHRIAEINRQLAALKKEAETIKDDVEGMFVEADEVDALINGVNLDGFKVKMVCGKTSRLDKKKLVALGCKPEWLEKATKTTDNKPYVRITPPGEKDDE